MRQQSPALSPPAYCYMLLQKPFAGSPRTSFLGVSPPARSGFFGGATNPLGRSSSLGHDAAWKLAASAATSHAHLQVRPPGCNKQGFTCSTATADRVHVPQVPLMTDVVDITLKQPATPACVPQAMRQATPHFLRKDSAASMGELCALLSPDATANRPMLAAVEDSGPRAEARPAAPGPQPFECMARYYPV